MNVITLLALLLVVPFLLLLVFLALSSCLGTRFRMRSSLINPGSDNYGRTYFRTMTNSGPAMSEHIEMESMLNDRDGFMSDGD